MCGVRRSANSAGRSGVRPGQFEWRNAVFFKSFDRNASSLCVRPRIRKSAAALAMAVAAALPTVAMVPSAAYGMTDVEQALVLLADQAKLTDPQLLTAGTEQYSKGQYEDAQATLQQVKAEGLPEADREKLTNILRKAEAALGERKAARAQFELGEQALADKNVEEALKYYRAAADNKFADEATKTKSRSQISVAEASQKSSKPDYKGLYKEAVADYRAERLDAAKAKFEQLAKAEYSPGLFDRKPKSYLKGIDEKVAEAKAAQEQAQAAAAIVTPPAPDKNDKPADNNVKVAENAKPADSTTKPADATAAAAATEQVAAAEVKPEVKKVVAGKQAYDDGVGAYNRGDYPAAKALFEESQAAKFNPGFFRDSPSRYLRMIDAKDRKAAEPVVQTVAEVNTTAVVPTTAPTAVETLSPAQRDLLEQARLEKLRQQQRAYESQQLVEQAAQAQKDNRLADAHTLYAQAYELDPTNRVAAEGKAQTQLAVTGGGEKPMVDREAARITLHKQIISYSFDKAIADAQAGIQAKNFTAAQESLDAATVAKESNPGIFNAADLQRFETTVVNMRMALAKAQETEAGIAARGAAQAAADSMAQRAAIEAQEQRRTVQSLARTAQQFVYDGQYTQALGVINQILAIDPSNDYAVGVKQLVQDSAIVQDQRKTREKVDLEFRKSLTQAEERKTPYVDVLKYPTNWPDISETRDRELIQERTGGGESLDTVSLMNKRLPAIGFEQAPLAEVVEFLHDVSGANIYVNWRMLESAGITRTTAVTATLTNVKFSQALGTVLKDVTGTGVRVGYAIEDGIITVSTCDDLNSKVVLNVYDVRDLLVVAPDFVEPPDFAPKVDPSRRGNNTAPPGSIYGSGGTSRANTTSGRYGLSSGAGQNGSGTNSGVVNSPRNGQKTQELLEDIAAIIKSKIDPESWTDNGGKFGSLSYLQGQLIVTQTPENQRQLVSLLDKLRETRAIQVSIETRFLTVERNFMEDIGVDIDFFFNINDPTHFSPIAVTQNSSAFTQSPATAAPNTIGIQQAPAIQIQGSYLDDFQANFLIRATQASRRSAIANAPRVTVFNGQQAFVIVAEEQAYVSDLEAVTGEGVGLYNPIPDVTASGVRLIVQPTVSADRKYVTLSLQPTITKLKNLVNFPVFGVSTPNNAGGGVPGNINVFQANIQLPIINVTAVNTIVSVPDGGTLLLGGQTIAGEIEIEEGVPILSKIPFIKRLFTNRSTAKDESVLLILVKPTIIMHREIESQQFPSLNTRPH
jgi:Flp pilus assembly secretin CpaC